MSIVDFVDKHRLGPTFQFLADHPPKLAVALGGALPQRLDERTAQKVWQGGEHKPGPPGQYQIKGL